MSFHDLNKKAEALAANANTKPSAGRSSTQGQQSNANSPMKKSGK